MASHKKADTSPTKEVVVNSLTKDASVDACLFDLVDNSIDSARSVIERDGGRSKDAAGLPASYKPFRVELQISATEIVIKDNASGISVDDLENRVLRFGQRADRSHGIGFYGVGLNRALFKLGANISLETDDGNQRCFLELNVADYLKKIDWLNDFDARPSEGKSETIISIRDLNLDVSPELSDPSWQFQLREQLGKRYHIFIEKGLKIMFQGKVVAPICVHLRENSAFPLLQKSYRVGEDIWVNIEAGQHSDHRFAAEVVEGKTINPKELTRDFGWSVICNDRQILDADRTEKTGWEPTWHGEYNGFVGRVHFVSPSPRLLPWNTSKTGIDEHNSVYRKALVDMQVFAHKWRQYTRLAKNAKKQGKPLPTPTSKPASAKAKQKSRRPLQNYVTPHERTIVSQDLDESACNGKLLQLLREAKRIDFFDNRYSGLALLRILFEISAIHFLKRTGNLDHCRTKCIANEEMSRGKSMSASARRVYMPSLSALLLYFTQEWHPLLGDSNAAYLQKSFDQFKKYKDQLDGAVHHPFHEVNPVRAIEIRDSIHPLLRHFIQG